MRILAKTVAFAILAAPVALVAQPAPDEAAETQAAEPEAAPEAKKEDKTVCRRMRMTGSRMTQRVCRLQSQWEAIEAGTADQELDSKAEFSNMGVPNPFGGREPN